MLIKNVREVVEKTPAEDRSSSFDIITIKHMLQKCVFLLHIYLHPSRAVRTYFKSKKA